MKTKTGLPGLIAAATLLSSSLVMAGPSYHAQGRVLKVEPIYETVRVREPERRCWDEEVRVHRRGRDSAVPTVAGAIVGGVVGNQFGKGSGKDAATVAGALLGGAVGNEIGSTPRRGYRVERHCERVTHGHTEEQVVAYRVKYEYDGGVYWTRTSYRPGKYIDLDVNIQPAR